MKGVIRTHVERKRMNMIPNFLPNESLMKEATMKKRKPVKRYTELYILITESSSHCREYFSIQVFEI